MLFNSLTSIALLASSAFVPTVFAQSGTVTVHVIKVSNKNGSLSFAPNNLTVPVGDMVQYQFYPKNHSVVQSTFDQPCQPIALHSNVSGVYSGFQPVAAGADTMPTYTFTVNNTTPIWFYCSQASHCQSGMVGVINPPAANASRTITSFAALAKNATSNLSPNGGEVGGTDGTVSVTGSATGTSGSTQSTSTNSANSVKFAATELYTFGGLLALGMALFV